MEGDSLADKFSVIFKDLSFLDSSKIS